MLELKDQIIPLAAHQYWDNRPRVFFNNNHGSARHSAKHFTDMILIIAKPPKEVLLSSRSTEEITEAQGRAVICPRPQAW